MTKRSNVVSLESSLEAVLAPVRAELEGLRDDIAKVQAELQEEELRPVDLAEAGRRVDDVLAHLQGQVRRAVHAGYFIAAEVDGSLGRELENARVTPVALAAALHPDLLRPFLMAEIERVAARQPAGVSAAERQRRVAGLRKRLRELERREAELLWKADDLGLDLPWRPDLPAEAVLGLDG